MSKKIIKFINIIIELFKVFSELGCFICIVYISSLTINDPFENHIIEDIDFSNYFYYIPDFPFNNNSYSRDLNDIIDGTSLINDTSLTDYFNDSDIVIDKANPSEDVTSDRTPLTIIPDVNKHEYTDKTAFCYDMYSSFNNYINQKFSYIFDLNYDTIQKFFIPSLIIFFGYLILYIFVEIDTIKIIKCYQKSKCIIQVLIF